MLTGEKVVAPGNRVAAGRRCLRQGQLRWVGAGHRIKSVCSRASVAAKDVVVTLGHGKWASIPLADSVGMARGGANRGRQGGSTFSVCRYVGEIAARRTANEL